MPKFVNSRFTNDILDIIQNEREERWFNYLNTPPSVDQKFMPNFHEFKSKVDERKIDYRQTANHTARVYRLISNPYHEENTFILDKFLKDQRVSIFAQSNEIVSVFIEGLDIELGGEK